MSSTLESPLISQATRPRAARSWRGLGRWSLIGLCVTVLTACIPIPVISYSPTPVVAGEAVSFDGSETIVSTFPTDNAVTSYQWSFGDGYEARGSTVTHTYSAAGTYTVTLTVLDTAGREGSTSEDITVYAATSTLTSSDTGSTSTDTSSDTSTDTTTEDTVVVLK